MTQQQRRYYLGKGDDMDYGRYNWVVRTFSSDRYEIVDYGYFEPDYWVTFKDSNDALLFLLRWP